MSQRKLYAALCSVTVALIVTACGGGGAVPHPQPSPTPTPPVPPPAAPLFIDMSGGGNINPYGIAAGPSSIAFTDQAANAVGTVPLSGGFPVEYTLQNAPLDVVYAAGYGQFLVGETQSGNDFLAINSFHPWDPSQPTHSYLVLTPAGDTHRGWALDNNQYIWAAVGSSSTPTAPQGIYVLGESNCVTCKFFFHPLAAGSDPYALAFDSSENLWITERGLKKQVEEMGPSGNIIRTIPLSQSADLIAITEGPNSTMYAADQGNSVVWPISENSGQLGAPINIKAPCKPADIKPGKNNDLWVTEAGCSQIANISATGVVTSYTSTGYNGNPQRLTVDSNGDVWFTDNALHKIFKFHKP